MSIYDDVLLVGYAKNNSNDEPVLIVGKKDKDGLIDAKAAFVGQEAEDLYKKLTTVVKPGNENTEEGMR